MDAQLNTSRRFIPLAASGLVIVALAAGLTHRSLFAAQAPPPAGTQQAEPAADPHLAEEQAAERQALGSLGYLDHGRYADSYTTTVPGAPDGQYVVLHYAASFANRQQAEETVTLSLAKGYWRVNGYYIK
jgi:Protein of unknown function (DUF4019)